MKKNKGITLLIALTVTSVLLLVSFVVANIAAKQLILGYGNQQSQYAFYNAESGLDCALYWDLKTATSSFDTSLPGNINCSNQAVSSGSQSVPTVPSQPSVVGGSGSGGGTDIVWVDDSNSPTLQPPANLSYNGGDNWTWVSSPTPYSGTESHESSLNSSVHQHYFYNTTNTLAINTGDVMYAYVYLDPSNPPTQIMLQWNVGGSWEHRAFWNNSGTAQDSTQLWGALGTDSQRYMGPLPSTGGWVKLSVPASSVGLEGQIVNGMAFTLVNGRAFWDKAGKAASGGTGGAGTSIFSINYTKGCSIVKVIKDGSGNTNIESRGYNVCASGAFRKYERGIKLSYTGNGATIPPTTCQDPTATNYGGALPCTYPAPTTCTDVSATNYGGALPCTYPPSNWGLTVNTSGTGSGTVSCNGSSCNPTYPDTTGLTLTATPTGSDTFSGWSGDCSGSGSCPLTMTSSKSVTATFNGPSSNVALASAGSTVTASSIHSSGFDTSYVINGERKGNIWGVNGGWNDGTQSVFPDWLVVDFNASRTINEVDVFFVQDNYGAPSDPDLSMTFTQYGGVDFQVQYWNGSSWQDVPGGNVTNNNNVWRQFTFSPLTTSKIRVYMTRGVLGDPWSRLTEVEAWGN